MLMILFVLSIVLFLYPLAIYPVLIAIVARLFPMPVQKGFPDSTYPVVTFIIPAFNEETVILEKIRNTLALDYPPDCLEVLVASDGSTDQTVFLSYSIKDPRLSVLSFPQRRGKLSVLDDAVQASRGELIVFSDASALLDPKALKNVVANFADPTVGCVSGRYVIQDQLTPLSDGRSVGEKNYFEFEVLQRRFESLFYSTLGAHGAFYALRKGLYPERPPGVINDDFVIPMLILKEGFRTVYEDTAIVAERHQTNVRGEFKRRVRISQGNFQQIWILRSLLGLRYPRVAFVFWSHKVIRAFQPLYLALIFAIPIALGGPFFLTFSILQAIFYGLGLFAFYGEKPKKILALPLYFTLGNTAIVAGLFNILKRNGRPRLQWEKS